MQFVPWCLRQELLAWDEEVVVKGEASGEFMRRGFKAAISRRVFPSHARRMEPSLASLAFQPPVAVAVICQLVLE